MRLAAFFLQSRDLSFIVVFAVGEMVDGGAALALDQHLHGAIGQLEQLQHGGEHADSVDVARFRIVLIAVFLGDEHDLLVGLHHLFQRADGFLTSDEERHNHVRKHDNVPQRQDGQSGGVGHRGALLAA